METKFQINAGYVLNALVQVLIEYKIRFTLEPIVYDQFALYVESVVAEEVDLMLGQVQTLYAEVGE